MVHISAFEISLPNFPNPVKVEHCKPVLISRILRDPQCWHYDKSKGELILVRTNRNRGGK